MIVADALNCQKETAKAVISGKGGYLFSVKSNQGSLEADIAEHVQDPALQKAVDTLDVYLGEDFCQVADKTIQKNFNILRKFALSIFKTFKQKTASKRPLSHIMFAGLLNPTSLWALLFEN